MIDRLFPCMEQPHRCFFSSITFGQRLSIPKSGNVIKTTKSRSVTEEFRLVPSAGGSSPNDNVNNDPGKVFVLQSSVGPPNGRYLSYVENKEGGETTLVVVDMKKDANVNEEVAKWRLTKSRKDSSSFHISTITTTTTGNTNTQSLLLSCDGSGNVFLSSGGHDEESDTTVSCSHPPAVSFNNERAAAEDEEGHFVDEITNENNNAASNRPTYDNNVDISTKWSIEFNSGELCFVSSPAANSRIRCDLVGKLSMSPNWKGWEVWRFIEAGGDGYVMISSWAHSSKFLCSNVQGDVFTTDNRMLGDGIKWSVERAPAAVAVAGKYHGVVIRSCASGRLLRLDDNNNNNNKKKLLRGFERFDKQRNNTTLHAVVEDSAEADDYVVWQLEAAHSQTYYISPALTNKRLGVSDRLYLTAIPIKKPTEEWKFEDTGEKGVIRLYTEAQSQYLISHESGYVSVSPQQLDSGLWWMRESLEGGSQTFISKKTGRILVFDAEGNLKTLDIPVKSHLEHWRQQQCVEERWQIEPRMPLQVTGRKIGSVAIAGAVTIGATLAAPFVVTGAIGLLAEAGIAAEVIAGSVLIVEAAVSVAAVGSTAKTLLETVTVGSEEGTKNNGDYPIKNRPFCNWRFW